MNTDKPIDLPPFWLNLTWFMGLVAGVLLMVLMVLVVVDIIARSFGLFSVYGIIELSRATLLLVACLGQAWVFAMRGHIVVDLLTAAFPPGITRYLDAIGYLLAGVGAAAVGYYMIQGGWEMHQVGERSETLQLSPLVFRLPAAFGLFVSSVTALMVVRSCLHKE